MACQQSVQISENKIVLISEKENLSEILFVMISEIELISERK